MAAKPDIAQLENLVAAGRHAEALEGYMKLLAARPGDPLLRSRVEMLKEAQQQSRAEPSVSPMTMPGGFSITQEEVADSYVLAGRYDDALILLERLQSQRPNDKAILDRIQRVRRLKSAGAGGGDGFEATAPQGNIAPPPPKNAPPRNATPLSRPAVTSRSSASVIPASRQTVKGPPSIAPRPRVDPVAAAAAATMSVPRSEVIPVITDESLDKDDERTLRSAPPGQKRPVDSDATVISPPPTRPAARRRDTVPDARTLMVQNPLVDTEDFSNSVKTTMMELQGDDGAKTVLADAPEGLGQALMLPEDASGFEDIPKTTMSITPPSFGDASDFEDNVPTRAAFAPPKLPDPSEFDDSAPTRHGLQVPEAISNALKQSLADRPKPSPVPPVKKK